jgi:hypothetical protein
VAKASAYLHQEIVLNSSPQKIYAVLLDSKQFSAFTGLPSEMDPKAGGTFSMFGGMIDVAPERNSILSETGEVKGSEESAGEEPVCWLRDFSTAVRCALHSKT